MLLELVTRRDFLLGINNLVLVYCKYKERDYEGLSSYRARKIAGHYKRMNSASSVQKKLSPLEELLEEELGKDIGTRIRNKNFIVFYAKVQIDPMRWKSQLDGLLAILRRPDALVHLYIFTGTREGTSQGYSCVIVVLDEAIQTNKQYMLYYDSHVPHFRSLHDNNQIKKAIEMFKYKLPNIKKAVHLDASQQWKGYNITKRPSRSTVVTRDKEGLSPPRTRVNVSKNHLPASDRTVAAQKQGTVAEDKTLEKQICRTETSLDKPVDEALSQHENAIGGTTSSEEVHARSSSLIADFLDNKEDIVLASPASPSPEKEEVPPRKVSPSPPRSRTASGHPKIVPRTRNAVPRSSGVIRTKKLSISEHGTERPEIRSLERDSSLEGAVHYLGTALLGLMKTSDPTSLRNVLSVCSSEQEIEDLEITQGTEVQQEENKSTAISPESEAPKKSEPEHATEELSSPCGGIVCKKEDDAIHADMDQEDTPKEEVPSSRDPSPPRSRNNVQPPKCLTRPAVNKASNKEASKSDVPAQQKSIQSPSTSSIVSRSVKSRPKNPELIGPEPIEIGRVISIQEARAIFAKKDVDSEGNKDVPRHRLMLVNMLTSYRLPIVIHFNGDPGHSNWEMNENGVVAPPGWRIRDNGSIGLPGEVTLTPKPKVERKPLSESEKARRLKKQRDYVPDPEPTVQSEVKTEHIPEPTTNLNAEATNRQLPRTRIPQYKPYWELMLEEMNAQLAISRVDDSRHRPIHTVYFREMSVAMKHNLILGQKCSDSANRRTHLGRAPYDTEELEVQMDLQKENHGWTSEFLVFHVHDQERLSDCYCRIRRCLSGLDPHFDGSVWIFLTELPSLPADQDFSLTKNFYSLDRYSEAVLPLFRTMTYEEVMRIHDRQLE